MGMATRSFTSLGVAPGMEIMTSIMGTLICGSSSRGSMTTAITPKRNEAMMMISVSLESTKAAAMRPAKPRLWSCFFMG